MAGNAWWAYGSKFQLGNDGTVETFATVAQVIDIGGPSMTRDVIEVSNQDSVNGFREFIPGWRNGGEISVTANWIPASSTQDGSVGILSKFLDDDVHNYKIITPSDGSDGTAGVTVTFSGIIVNFGLNLPLNEQAKVDFGIQITSNITVS